MLPGKKPCKDCGFPTCFAFAMKLATGGAPVDKCIYLTPEVKAKLEDLLAPAIKLVTIGTGDNKVQVGNEEVIYRHEKTYVHPPGVAILISDKESDAKVDEKIKKLKELQFPWVGLTLKAELLALQFESGDKNKFLALVKKASATNLGMILISQDLDTLFAARDLCADKKPLLYPITKENIDQAIPKIKAKPTPVGVRGASIEELIPLTTKLKEAGVDEAVLDPGSKNLMEAIKDQTFIRRAALKQGFRPLGYPTIAFPCFMAKDGLKEALTASVFVNKFAALIVLSDFDQYSLLPLLVRTSQHLYRSSFPDGGGREILRSWRARRRMPQFSLLRIGLSPISSFLQRLKPPRSPLTYLSRMQKGSASLRVGQQASSAAIQSVQWLKNRVLKVRSKIKRS